MSAFDDDVANFARDIVARHLSEVAKRAEETAVPLRAAVAQLESQLDTSRADNAKLTAEIVTLQKRIAELEPKPQYGPRFTFTSVDNIPPELKKLYPADAVFVPYKGGELEDELKALGDKRVLVIPDGATALISPNDGFKAAYPEEGGGQYRTIYRGNNSTPAGRKNYGILLGGPNAKIHLPEGTHETYVYAPDLNPDGSKNEVGNPNKVGEWYLKTIIANGVFTGENLGKASFSNLAIYAPDSVVAYVKMQGAWRGDKASQPRETGGINVNRADGVHIHHVELDGRKPDGTLVGSSPLMVNNTVDPLVEDSYFHHALAGMPTWHTATNPIIRRVRSEFMTGANFNFEKTTGKIRMESCGYKNKAAGKGHIAVNGYSSVKVEIVEPDFDGMEFLVSIWGGTVYANIQQLSDVSIVHADGTPFTKNGKPITIKRI